MIDPVTALQQMKVATETALPALFTAAGLDDLTRYVYGSTQDTQETELAFYLGPGDVDTDYHNFKPVVQMQLPRTSYVDGLKYFKIVFEYFRDGLDACVVGMTELNRITYTEYPPDETSTCVFSFYVEYQLQLDGCDN